MSHKASTTVFQHHSPRDKIDQVAKRQHSPGKHGHGQMKHPAKINDLAIGIPIGVDQKRAAVCEGEDAHAHHQHARPQKPIARPIYRMGVLNGGWRGDALTWCAGG